MVNMISVVYMLVCLQLLYLLLHVCYYPEQLTFLGGSSHPLFGFCLITLYPELCLRDDLIKLLLSHITVFLDWSEKGLQRYNFFLTYPN